MTSTIRSLKPAAVLCQSLGKRIIALFLGLSLFVSHCETTAADAATTIAAKSGELQGIVSLSGKTQAFFEIPGPRGLPTGLILGTGEREMDVEVLQIDEEAGTVKIKQAGETIELAFDNEAEPLVTPTPEAAIGGQGKPLIRFRLQNATPSQVFHLYQTVAGRSLLRPSTLASFNLSLRSNGTVTTKDFMAAVERALAEKGFHFQPDGEKLVIFGRETDLSTITPQLREIAEQLDASRRKNSPASRSVARASSLGAESGEDLVPAEFIVFRSVDLNQGLAVFQDLVGCTLIRDSAPSGASLTFRTQTPLKHSEVIYAFGAMLALNNISIMPAGEKFLLVFPTSAKSRATSVLAKHGHATVDHRKELMPAGSIYFSGAPLEQAIAIYKALCGCDIELDPGLRTLPMSLRTQTPLTPAEALQALDLSLALNGIEAVRQPDGALLKFVRQN